MYTVLGKSALPPPTLLVHHASVEFVNLDVQVFTYLDLVEITVIRNNMNMNKKNKKNNINNTVTHSGYHFAATIVSPVSVSRTR